MKTIIWLVIVSLPFFNFFIFPNISFADVGLIIGCFGLFFYDNKSIFFIIEKKYNYLIYILIWVVLSSLILLLNYENFYISSFGIVKNILRFLIIIIIFNNIALILNNKYWCHYFFKIWIKTIYFICLLAVIEYILNYFGIYYSYYFENITTTTSRKIGQNSRVSSIFNEPSYLVIYLNFSLLLITEFYNKYKSTSNLNYIRLNYIIFFILTLANSIIGFVLFSFIFISNWKIIFGESLKFYKLKYLIFISIFFGLIISFNNIRFNNILNYEDGSSNHRFLGAIELTKIIYNSDFRFTGVGLGQQKLFLDYKVFSFEDHFYMKGHSRNSGINNMFLLIFIQLGIVGLLLYLYFLNKVLKHRKKVLLLFIISGFGWAFTFNPVYWLCLSSFNVLINGKKKNSIYIN